MKRPQQNATNLPSVEARMTRYYSSLFVVICRGVTDECFSLRDVAHSDIFNCY